MNQGRIWCVVKPTVGLPLFIGSVAATALIVHYSILSHTTWFSSYWNGGAKKSAATESTQPLAGDTKTGDASGVTMSVQPVAAANGTTQFVITVTPKTGEASPQSVALAAPDPK